MKSTPPTVADPSPLGELLGRLEAAWHAGPSPSLEPFLPPPGSPSRLQLLHRLIEHDLQIAWRRRQGWMLEQYLKRHPELGPKRDLPAALVFAEYQARSLAGEPAPADEYRRRFPEQFPELMRLIAADADTDGPTGTLLAPASGPPAHAAAPPGRSGPRTIGDDVHTLPGAPPPSEPPSTHPLTLAGAPRPDPAPSLPPSAYSQVLPVSEGFKLLRRIGRGQYGEVFLAEAPGGVNVAVKRIFRSLDDESSQRELQSLQLIRELRHPYLLQTQAFWSLEDRLVIVMELADGSLAEWHRDAGTGIPVAELLAYFREAAEALDYLHGMNVIHRDVKPANLLRLKGHAKVADFGLARMMEAGQLAAATFCGTPRYMAPETWKQKACPQSDQYGLAAAYAEMRTGRPLFPGTDYMDVCTQHMTATPDLNPLGPPERAALLRALAKKPEERYPDCRSFVEALAAALAPPPPSPPPSAAAPPPARRARGWGAVALALGLLALIGALVAAWALARPGPSPSPTSPSLAGAPTAPRMLLPPGCQPEGADVDGRYYKRVLLDPHPAGAPPILFLLIPPTKPDDPPPFYVMRDKVSNGQFNAAAADPAMNRLLEEAAKAGPWAVRREWNKDGRGEPGQASLPVVYVTFPEARCFAHYLGGELPTAAQWDKAAGRYDGAEGPFRPGEPAKGLAIAHNRGGRGPIPVGDPAGDETVFGCRDMADNGREWTDAAPDGSGRLPDALDASEKVYLRGVDFIGDEVFRFADLVKHSQMKPLRDDAHYDLGFRVVIEAPKE